MSAAVTARACVVAVVAIAGCGRSGAAGHRAASGSGSAASDGGASAGVSASGSAAATGSASPPALAPAVPTGAPLVIERITIHTDAPALDQAQLAAQLRAAMLTTDAFTEARGVTDPAGGMVRVDATVAATTRAAARGQPPGAVVATEITLRWVPLSSGGDEPAPHAHVAAERPLTRAEQAHPDDGVRALAADVMAAAGHDLAVREHERGLPVAALRPLLTSADEQQVTWALELAGARRARALVPAITPLVAHPGPVHDAAVTALVAIGDPAAVAAITAAVDFDDRTALATAIEAAIALGGPDAQDFLELIASGHHDADLATRARDGLRRIAHRQGSGAPP